MLLKPLRNQVITDTKKPQKSGVLYLSDFCNQTICFSVGQTSSNQNTTKNAPKPRANRNPNLKINPNVLKGCLINIHTPQPNKTNPMIPSIS